MPGALDSAFRQAAEAVVKDLGTSLDVEIDYLRQVSGDYNVSTGAYTDLQQTYSDIRAPIEFIDSEEEEGREERKAKLYVTPNLIGDNQPTFEDTISLTYAGSSRVAQITDIRTFKGGQEYFFVIEVRF